MAVKWSRDWIWPLSTKRLQRGANGLIASRHSSQKLSSYAQNFSTKNDMVGHWSGPYHHIRSIFFFPSLSSLGFCLETKTKPETKPPGILSFVADWDTLVGGYYTGGFGGYYASFLLMILGAVAVSPFAGFVVVGKMLHEFDTCS